LIWQVQQKRQAMLLESYAGEPTASLPVMLDGVEALALYPVSVGPSRNIRAILGLHDTKPRGWLEADRQLLDSVSLTLGLALEAAFNRERLEALVKLERELFEVEPEEVYGRLLKVVVALVPGVEAGSLLLRDGGRFGYKAAEVFDLKALSSLSYSLKDQLLWYGKDMEAWKRGEPRILSRHQMPFENLAYLTAPEVVMDGAGQIQEIQANLCLPIVYRGEVLAVLDLDNLHDPEAFSQDSLEVAQLFAPSIAALLHETRQRKLLDEAAHTDALTGLANRRAFDQAFAEELSRSHRYNHPLTLLVMDLYGFKQINDQLGHAKGDLALIRVAEALKAERRGSDSFYRWGGDEFAVLLPHTAAEGAVVAVQRYAKAIASITTEGVPLSVNVGIASYPSDAATEGELLELADDRMYQAKRSKTTLRSGSP
jgi:diguanylate cyclase (GGDEF)-like protein